MKDYYAAKQADYNIKLRASVRAMTKRDADIPGASELGIIDVQPTIPVTSTLDRKENAPNECNEAAVGRTSDRADPAIDDSTTRSHPHTNSASSKVPTI